MKLWVFCKHNLSLSYLDGWIKLKTVVILFVSNTHIGKGKDLEVEKMHKKRLKIERTEKIVIESLLLG